MALPKSLKFKDQNLLRALWRASAVVNVISPLFCVLGYSQLIKFWLNSHGFEFVSELCLSTIFCKCNWQMIYQLLLVDIRNWCKQIKPVLNKIWVTLFPKNSCYFLEVIRLNFLQVLVVSKYFCLCDFAWLTTTS